MISRRDLYRYLTMGLGGAIGFVLGAPGIAYLLDPILRRVSGGGGFVPLARLGELEVGVPRSFPVIRARRDAWVKYPPEPIGSVWLVRQPGEGSKTPVVAFTSECPHLGCAINLEADGKAFLCPCHTSKFTLDGKPMNPVPPRGMDSLEVKLSSDSDPKISVRFERFRTMSREKTPLV